MKIIISFAISLIALAGFGQEKITVQFSNKEIVEIQKNKKKFDYSNERVFLEIDSNRRYYVAKEIDYVKTSDFTIISSMVYRDKIFNIELLQPIAHGLMSLYQSKYVDGKACFYFQKADSTIYAIPEKHFRNYIIAMFSDCDKLDIRMNEESLSKYSYNANNLSELVCLYNKFMKPDSVTDIKRIPTVKLKTYAEFGLVSTMTEMNTLPYKSQDFSPKYSPKLGFHIGFEYFNRFVIYGGINYSQIGGNSDFTTKGLRLNDAKELMLVNVNVQLDYSLYCLEVPLTLRIKPFHFHNITPFIELGPKYFIIFKEGSEVIADDDYKEGIDYLNKEKLSTFNIGKFLNVGVEISKHKRAGAINLGISDVEYLSHPITAYSFSELGKARVKFIVYSLTFQFFL